MTRPPKAGFGWRSPILLTVAITFLVFLVFRLLGGSPFFAALEGQTLDWRFQLRGPLAPSSDIAIVTIDDSTLAELGGQWPLPRARLAEAVEKLSTAGAKVIAFDLLLLGADRFFEPALESALPAVSPGDAALAAAIEAAVPVVLPYALVFDATENTVPELPKRIEETAYRILILPPGGTGSALPVPSAIAAPPAVLLVGADSGHVNVFPDADGSLRMAKPVLRVGEAFLPSLPVEVARLFLGLGRDQLAVRFGQGLKLGPQVQRSDAHMQFPVNFYGPSGSFTSHSFRALLEGRIPDASLAGKAVFIGATALSLGDTFTSPYGRNLPGVEFLATVTENLIQGSLLERSARTFALDVFAIVLLGLLAGWLVSRASPLPAALMAGLVLLGWSLLAYLAFAKAGLWLNYSFPAAAIVLTSVGGILLRSFGAHRLWHEADRQRGSLTRYVSPVVAQQVARGGRGSAPDRTQTAAVMFIDIQGFTTLSETMDPAETMVLLREFHRRVESAVRAHRGVVDKFIGDGVMVIFGLPEPSPEDAAQALNCAVDIAKDVAAWQESTPVDGVTLRAKLGVHFGAVTVGEVGGETQAQLTAMGDTVNVASRLEALTRELGVTVAASEAAMDAARAGGGAPAGFTELPPQAIRGRRGTMVVWGWDLPGA